MDVPEETEGERERREEAERRKEEAEDNARLWPEAEGIGRRAEDAFLEGIFTDPRDLKEAREHYNRKMRLDSFLKDVDNKFRRVAVELQACAYSPMSEGWAVKDLEKRSKEFEKMTEQIRKFIDYGIDPPPVEVAPPPNEKFASVPQRAQVRNPATMLRRCRMKKFRHVLRTIFDRDANPPPRRTGFCPKYGWEYSW